MTHQEYDILKTDIWQRLHDQLPPFLYYHNPAHTFRVLKAAEEIAAFEGINGRDLLLIKVAVLYHDLGFIYTQEGHEEEACRLAELELPAYHLDKNDIEIICQIIRATKMPRNVQNLLEAIVADADLEYLGTDDYTSISSTLYQELKYMNPHLSNEKWKDMQIKLLENHEYFTAYGRSKLEAKKKQHLEMLKHVS